MFGIGSTEFLVIILVALLVLGPRNLAKASRTVGKYMGEFRRISTDFQRTLNAEVADEEREENREAIRKKVAKAKAARARKLKAEKEAQAAQTQNASTAQESQAEGAAQAQTQTGAKATVQAEKPAEQKSVEQASLHAAADENMVQPPVGSPLEAMLKKTAQEAAESSGETVPQFIERAVQTQAQRDKTSRSLGIDPATGGKIGKE